MVAYMLCNTQLKKCESLPTKKELIATIARLVKTPARQIASTVKQVGYLVRIESHWSFDPTCPKLQHRNMCGAFVVNVLATVAHPHEVLRAQVDHVSWHLTHAHCYQWLCPFLVLAKPGYLALHWY